MPNDYALVREKRKGPKITMGKGMQRVEPDPSEKWRGVTDPKKLLHAEPGETLYQRIDPLNIDPSIPDNRSKGLSPEPITKI